jgi:hypothetical protein
MEDEPRARIDQPLFSRRALGSLRMFEPDVGRLEAVPIGESRIFLPPAAPPPAVTPPPAAAPPPAPAAPLPPLPQAAPANPLADLPYPSRGDRIKAEDFRQLAQALQVLADAFALSGATFGHPFGQMKLALAAQQYEIARVVSVHGAELAGADDASLDDRRVLQVMPVVLGERRVSVVLSETAADTRRYAPDLTGLTYRQALERLRLHLGDAAARGGPMLVPQLTGLTLTEAGRRLSG